MIYIASDHEGWELKKQIIEYLKTQGREVTDCGPENYDPNDDYPNFIYPCAQKVGQGAPEDRGIVLGLSGQGEAIAANKAKGVRAALYYGFEPEIVKLSRHHNDSNVLALGSKFLSFEQIKEAIDIWLQTPFDGGRHERRVKEISALE
jgi:ribose 5-phosphate isomerase B